MARSLWIIAAVSGLVLVGGLVAVAVQKGALGDREPPPAEWMDWSAIDSTVEFARISGMAHYDLVITQEIPGNLFREPQTVYLYGLFPPHDTESRMIKVLVRSPVQPEEFVSYELMTLEGWVHRPTPDRVPYDVEPTFWEHSDYYFSDGMVLIEAVTLEEGLDPRVGGPGGLDE